jgi:uncharacterized protein YcbK (DUF882 family)
VHSAHISPTGDDSTVNFDQPDDNFRRRLLFAGLAAGLVSAAPGLAEAAEQKKAPVKRTASATPKPARNLGPASGPVPLRPAGQRSLALQVVNTGERFDAVYWRDGNYVPEALQRLDRVLRDHRAGVVAHMDPKLYDMMWEMQQRLDVSEPWRVISAYRSPKTNAAARKHGGVARNSFHLHARAVDIDLASRSTRAIRQVAVQLQAGGVGQYPRSDFIHIDTGPVRVWG